MIIDTTMILDHYYYFFNKVVDDNVEEVDWFLQEYLKVKERIYF